MHWGHAVSKDLLDWEHQGIALYPSRYEDQNGCFSGSAIEHDGRMYIYYTGVHYTKTDPKDIHRLADDRYASCQMLLVSGDGMHFDDRNGKRVIIPPIKDKKIGDRTHTRDPKVWKGRDGWYMVLGSSGEDKNGKLLFYRSKDLFRWELAGQTGKKEGFGWMWECPDLFTVEGGTVLLFSPMGFLKDGSTPEDQTICMLADFDEETCMLDIPDRYQFFDYGLDLYATQSTLDEKGRRIVIAWLRMPEPVDGRWCGMFCFPRVVEVEQGHIYFRVHPDIEAAYARKIERIGQADPAGYRVKLALQEGRSLEVGGYRIMRKDGRICTDRTAVCPKDADIRRRSETPPVREGDWLDIYVDKDILEIYVNNGEYVLTHAVSGLSDEICTDVDGQVELYTYGRDPMAR